MSSVQWAGGSSSLYSTFRPHADLSLATVIHSLSCLLSLQRASWGKLCKHVVWSAEVSLLVLPYTMRPEILTLPLHWVWEPSASSRFHQRVHRGWVCNHSSNVFIRDPFSATSHIVSPHILRRHSWWKASSLDLSVFQCPARFPRVLYSQQSLDRACDGYRSVFLLPSNCLFMEPNSFLAWLIRSVMSLCHWVPARSKIFELDAKDIKRSASISMSSISAADDSCPGLKVNGLRFRVFAFSTSSVNSQTKTSKVRDDKLEAAITSPRLRRMKAVSRHNRTWRTRTWCPCWSDWFRVVVLAACFQLECPETI
jgi:hypothetical protein